jgi:hypothetical protein
MELIILTILGNINKKSGNCGNQGKTLLSSVKVSIVVLQDGIERKEGVVTSLYTIFDLGVPLGRGRGRALQHQCYAVVLVAS